MQIYPTAIVSSERQLADYVSIGPYAIIDGAVTLGVGRWCTPIRGVIGPVTMGARNEVHTGAVIGDWPQDRKFRGDFSETKSPTGDDTYFS